MTAQGFPAFPPLGRGARRLARSWWARQWLAAVEDTLLARDLFTAGRRYANAGQVGSITISPGRIDAAVHDGDPDRPHQARVLVERLTDAEWDRLLDQIAGRAGHLAALLERELPQELVADAADAGIALLPGIGDLSPECGCADWGQPCRHAAALCHQVAWLLDADPWLLLLIRGRAQPEVLHALGVRRAGTAAVPAEGAAAAQGSVPVEDSTVVRAAAAARARALLSAYGIPAGV